MKYLLAIIILSFIFLSQRAYSQGKSNNDIVLKAIDKNGKAFLKNKNIASVSIGVLKDGKIYTQHFGEIENGKSNAPDNETIYEIGSVSKTMTGYLVAKAVVAKKIKLKDDVRLYLNGDYSNLEYNNKPLTIQHLVTHTSGLPMSLPTEMGKVFENLDENVPEEYYEIEKSYDKENFLADLKRISLNVEPGTAYSYSNTGAELIGYILEKVYEKSIDALLKEIFLDESKMLNTGIDLSEKQTDNLVRGYWMGNKTLSPLMLNKLWGTAGGVKMNMNDMIRYMELQLDPVNPIVAESHKVLYDDENTLKVAYFWRVRNDKYGTYYDHHGGTTGTQNWLFIFPDHKLGISIITNQSGPKTPKLLSKTVKRILKKIVKA
jgi:CubicO group peptidase (beta-lactamase class C family)